MINNKSLPLTVAIKRLQCLESELYSRYVQYLLPSAFDSYAWYESIEFADQKYFYQSNIFIHGKAANIHF